MSALLKPRLRAQKKEYLQTLINEDEDNDEDYDDDDDDDDDDNDDAYNDEDDCNVVSLISQTLCELKLDWCEQNLYDV